MSMSENKSGLLRRRMFVVVLAVVAVIATLFILRSGDDGAKSDTPVLGTRPAEAAIEEEIGVFEYDTVGEAVVVDEPAREAAMERRQRAIADMPRYQSELSRNPRSPLAMNNFAWSLHLVGRYEDAEAYLREVIRISPDRAIAYANLGETLWKQGKASEAAAMYQKFLDLNEDPRRERIAQHKVSRIRG